ncbi:MAG: RDD family protein [Actinomycetota bacterium]|nr:RDD family protein [Actinomycetota bacterium]
MSGTIPPEHSGPERRERLGPPTPAGEGWSAPEDASRPPGRDLTPPPPRAAADPDGVTPQGSAAGQIADVGRRVSADLVDFLILAILGAAVGVVLDQIGLDAIVAPRVQGEFAPRFGLSAVPATLVTLTVHLGYWTLLEGRGGQSVGKLVLRIRAVREDASSLDYMTALKRHVIFYLPQVLGWVPSLVVLVLAGTTQVVLMLAGLVTYMIDEPLRQGFHDKFAGTIVVNA